MSYFYPDGGKEAGRVAERGTHEKLLAAEGHYAEFHRTLTQADDAPDRHPRGLRDPRAGETGTWEDGRCLLFDYAFGHQAWTPAFAPVRASSSTSGTPRARPPNVRPLSSPSLRSANP